MIAMIKKEYKYSNITSRIIRLLINFGPTKIEFKRLTNEKKYLNKFNQTAIT